MQDSFVGMARFPACVTQSGRFIWNTKWVIELATSCLFYNVMSKKNPTTLWQDSFVGMARFELATSWSQTRRDNRATLHPERLRFYQSCGERISTVEKTGYQSQPASLRRVMNSIRRGRTGFTLTLHNLAERERFDPPRRNWFNPNSTQPCGEGGIRTLGTGLSPYNGLANRPFRPLRHLS